MTPADRSTGPAGPAGLLAFGPAGWADGAGRDLAASHRVLLRSPGPAGPASGADGAARLELVFNDIAAARPGLVAPDTEAVRRLLDFAAGWDGGAPLLVSCYAGVSRSTAAAYAVACLKRGPGQEEALARTLREACAAATPNPLLVALADRALGRAGAMVRAIQAIGRGAEAFEGAPVVFDLSTGAAQAWTAAPRSTAASQACSTAPSTSPV